MASTARTLPACVIDQTTYTVHAFNTATASQNKIHDDEVARRFGFRGGLVPGVDVYAYLTHVPAEMWGLDWLRRGTMSARFATPVYDGDDVEITAELSAPDTVALTLRDSQGSVCAKGEATLPEVAPSPPPDPAEWPDVATPDDPPDASPTSLAPGTALALGEHTFVADRASEYLADVREDLPLYTDERVAHPGWLLRDANYVLSQSVRLGPWIHVGSTAQHLDLVRDGARVSARALVTSEWEHKGHRFVTLDVLLLADARPVARVEHTAIHTPRR